MDENLFTSLVTRNLLHPGCEITAIAPRRSTSIAGRDLMLGCYTFLDWNSDGNSISIKASSPEGGILSLPLNHVRELDGQNPARFAESHDIAPDGTKMILGNKRGRKRKIRD